MPYCQELTEHQKNDIKYSTIYKQDLQEDFSNELSIEKMLDYTSKDSVNEHSYTSFLTNMSTIEPNESSVSSITSVLNLPIGHNSSMINRGMFGFKETSVFMTLSDKFCRLRSSTTQATASINKCFQVSNECLPQIVRTIASSADNCSNLTKSTLPYHRFKRVVPNNLMNPSIYFWGRKRDEREPKGMGPMHSSTRLNKTIQTSTHAVKKKISKTSIRPVQNTCGKNRTVSKPNSKPTRTSTAAANGDLKSKTEKTVSIKDEKPLKPCPALAGTTKGDMMVTVSHIRIGPKETCPVHGNEACQGPKCKLASSGEEQGPVRITTVNNPRRGVFEIVIRKLTGAPLAKNELMLEWTPPPSRPPSCGGPCPTPYLPPGSYRPSKCKVIVCRASPCKPKFCKKQPYGRVPCGHVPCGRIPCREAACRSCKKCCKSTCCDNPCKPCGPCKPCPSPLCSPPACTSPCKSSPCLRPCPIGHKRQRRSRSQPRIKPHRKKTSPCNNRSKACPIVRCRSVPDACVSCCVVPPICLPRKCCSVVPCKRA